MKTTTISPAYNLIVLDESGSMEPLRQPIISGLNEIVQTIRSTQEQYPEQAHYLSLVTFNGDGIKTLHDRQPIEAVSQFKAADYRPQSLTPLDDALGISLLRLESQIEQEQNPTVLVSILTDGLENASREYNEEAIRALIERLKAKGWTFTYMGANHDVEQTAGRLSIKSSLRFQHSEQGMSDLFAQEKKSRKAYYEKRREGMDSGKAEEGFFDYP